ncbi:peptide chain release factor N(5)-glutamine methyltransferase [Nocardioides sp. Iso805N]|uniref:peptide chain release factor N(5)-glutamine methyltransferase n=1 Tax=Nocardioides sp. Iso805N TaxID=1283287 RepID=UPI0003770531|nr:peptide chain release factor N(5)-glutamine methyltransferase [Nocardioides sp. Iso805N]
MSDSIKRREVIAAATQRLREGGVASPEYDAAELLAHVLGTGRAQLVLVDEVAADRADAFEQLVARRAAREPLQHLTGVAHFRHVELAVGPGVFVPRPETELLAGWAIEALRQAQGPGSVPAGPGSVPAGPDAEPVEAPVVVDLCTGSGAIAKAIKDEVPAASVHAVELSEDAYPWAERNLAGAGIDLRQGDMATAFTDLDGAVDVVVCNPPYIPLEAWESVAAEARDHDPHLALFSGQDGLDAIRVLERRAAQLLRLGGVVGFEHADEQGELAPAIFSATGRWTDVRDHQDLAGRPRFVTARLAR